MTRALQKRRERIFVEEAARLLDKPWDLGDDREHPDFIVSDGGHRLGLEVTQIFVGPHDDAGSSLKAAESMTQGTLRALQREYEAIENIPLVAKFVGNTDVSNLATVIPALLAEDLQTRPVAYRFVHDTTVANPDRARLRVHITKAFRPDWYSVNDRAGFVNRNPHETIDKAIIKKAAQLPRYIQTAGSDVRLLLVADRIHNSGKLTLDGGAEFDLRGFSAVYLFPYPENVIILKNQNGS